VSTFDEVRERIAAACLRAGREPSAVRLIAVSKGVPVERLRVALADGITDFGENRVQEAETKVGRLPSVRWHMVGRLQSNKAARAVALFDEIHSVDSIRLAGRLGRLAIERGAGAVPVYLQVNTDADPDKAGFTPAQLERGLPELVAIDGLSLRGLMTIGRYGVSASETRASFRSLRELGERLRSAQRRLGAGLSMGMSDDFELAVEEGATDVRIGRALFGERTAG
jgi:PLP dependent protein